MKQHKESHMDHGFTKEQWAYIFGKFVDRTAFFIETIELPGGLGTVTDELYGPSVGDPPVSEADVVYAKRGDRKNTSRLVLKPKRETRFVRVIAGPHEETCTICEGKGEWSPMAKMESGHMPGSVIKCEYCTNGVLKHACILYTAYGVRALDTPASPREPGDIRLEMEKLEEVRREYFRALNDNPQPRSEEVLAKLKAAEQDAHAKIVALRPKRDEADAFWAQHALAAPLSMMPCADCGAPRMGDAVYDPPVPDTDGRCQTCGML